MAGSKHGRSGGSEGAGEVSPLASQLQQAWLQTQMPKIQKRTFTSLSKNQSQPSRLSSSGPVAEQSALKSLSSIFPELANMPEEKKPMISSVFKDGEARSGVPLPAAIQTALKKRDLCLEIMFTGSGEKNLQGISCQTSVPQTKRSLSGSLTQNSSGSSEFSVHGPPFSASHSFSGSIHRDPSTPELFEDAFSSMGGNFAGTPPVLTESGSADLDPESSAEVAEEKIPLFSYLSDILMDESIEDKKCMFVEVSAYQAMAKELGDLISSDSPSPPPYQNDSPSPTSFQNNSPEYQYEEGNGLVDSWIEEILSGPLPAELGEGHDVEHGGFKSFARVPSQTDSGSGSCYAVEDERDAEAEVADFSIPIQNSSMSLPHEDTLYLQSKENGLDTYGGFQPVVAPGNSNGVNIPPVDLTNLLIRCAQAVEQSDFRHANELIGELRQHSSAYGNGPQRMAHYFMEALVARMSGTGGQLYSALANNRPSEAQMLRGFRLFCRSVPFIQISNVIANHTILEAFSGAPRVHIIDYGILYGVQWPCLIHRLATRPEGPPHLRITGIDRPLPGFRPSGRIQETGRRLAAVAKEMGVPFEFHAIAEKWEAITPAHLLLRDDEVLAVNCMFRMRHLLDETVTAASPRTLVLNRIRSLNPKVFTQGVLNGAYNAPFFMSRFQEALTHFSSLFDAMEKSMPADHPDRLIIDQEVVGREILNVVACEGLERVERVEPYRQWQARCLRAGFQQKAISSGTLEKVNMLMRTFHADYGIGRDGHWFLIGWKDKIIDAITAWEPASVSP